MKRCQCGHEGPGDDFRNRGGGCRGSLCRTCYNARDAALKKSRGLAGKCHRCGGPGSLRSICDGCMRKNCRNTQGRRRLRKLQAIDYKGGHCEDCGHANPIPDVFDFHHKDPSSKDLEPSRMFRLAWENVVGELDKCVLLCANCHRIRHFFMRAEDAISRDVG